MKTAGRGKYDIFHFWRLKYWKFRVENFWTEIPSWKLAGARGDMEGTRGRGDCSKKFFW